MTDPPATLHFAASDSVLLLSDLHLGDGSRTDLFGARDDELLALLGQLAGRFDALVLAGDVLDIPQAGRVERIFAAHGRVLARLDRLAGRLPVALVLGNHDTEAAVAALLPRARVCRRVLIGDQVRVVHGHEFDIHFHEGPLDGRGQRALKAHDWVERLTGQPIRLPFGEFDNPTNRFAHWLFYRLTMADRLLARALSRLGRPSHLANWAAHHDYWARSQWGDAQALLLPALAALAVGAEPVLVFGHSHQPGLLSRFDTRAPERVSGEPAIAWRTAERRAPPPEALAGRVLVNLGSWALGQASWGLWRDGRVELRDWPRGRPIDDRAYRLALRPAEIPGMREWWDRYYRGLLRYDTRAVCRDLAPISAPATARP